MNELATTAGGSLAIHPTQTFWTPEQTAVLRQAGISDKATNAELAGFLHLCQRTQLDPFSRQIYLIGRWDRRAGREVFTPQTGIDGYRVIAHRVVAGSRDTFGYEDTVWCDESGQWRDVWLAPQPPAAVKVTVLRNGQRFSAVALFTEYAQRGKEDKLIGLWGKMPASQLAKCAEALALRKAFPYDLAGVYTAEEMAQADNPQPAVFHQIEKPAAPQVDEWSTPVQAARDFVHEASECTTADCALEVYAAAMFAGADEEILGEIRQIGARLRAAGREADQKAAATHGGGMDGVDAEPLITSDEEDYAAAVAELRTAAESAGLDMNHFEADAANALGMVLADAPVDAIRALAQQINPTN